MFKNWQISVKHFKNSEIEAQKKALGITTQIKTLLQSKEAITIEKLTGIQDLGSGALAIIDKFIKGLESPVIAEDIDLANALLGRLGGQLTGFIHEGCEIVEDIQDWIILFERLFQAGK